MHDQESQRFTSIITYRSQMEHSLGFQLRHVELRQCDPVLERLHHAGLKIGLLQEAQGVHGVPTHEQEVYHLVKKLQILQREIPLVCHKVPIYILLLN